MHALYAVTSDLMGSLDRRTIQQLGLPGLLLMELAGKGAADLAWCHAGLRTGSRVAVAVGGGNNGGDGWVMARHLANQGAEVRVFLLVPREKVTGDARMNMEIWQRLGGWVEWCAGCGDLQKHGAFFASADLRVDAMLGTGLSSPLRGVYGEAVEWLNCLPASFTLAVDVPTGLCSDTGQLLPLAVKAQMTVTFGLPKVGLLLYPGASWAGKVEVVDIGIPPSYVNDAQEGKVRIVSPGHVAKAVLHRRPDSHKGTFGHLLVVAGSKDKPGAAVLSARSGLRAGAGLVTLASVKEAREAAVAAMPELMVEALEMGDGDQMGRLMEGKAALMMGPGMGVSSEAAETVRKAVETFPGPMLLDADALNLLAWSWPGATGLDLLQQAPGPRLLTPHPKEASRLLGISVEEVQRDRLSAATKLCNLTKACVLLKGARSIVACPDGRLAINLTGGPALATAGTGDVLSGVIGALLAQGAEPGMALMGGAYLHGVAGDMAGEQQGLVGVTASDVDSLLPSALCTILGSCSA